MSAVDAGVVFLPRFTALVGDATFTTAPLDVSRQGGAQFQVWRGPIRVATGAGSLTLFLEESLDAQSWSLGPSVTTGIPILEAVTHFLSYSFRLRWFRLKFTLAGDAPMVSCWAEGLLRGGGEGMWGAPPMALPSPGAPHGAVTERSAQPQPWWVNDPDALGASGGVLSSGTPLNPRDYATKGAWLAALDTLRRGWSVDDLRSMWTPGTGAFGPAAPPVPPPLLPPK